MTDELKPSARDIDLAEFQKLRDEITARMQHVNAIVGIELTALGVGISAFTKIPDVLLGLAAVCSFLWLLWLDYAEQVQKIAAYIAIRLRPRLRAGDVDVLNWETYMRQLDSDPATALYGASDPARRLRMPHTQAIGNYIAGLFAGGPIILLSIYGVLVSMRFEDGSLGQVGRFVGIGIAATLWLLTVRQYIIFRRLISTMEDAIAASDRSSEPVN